MKKFLNDFKSFAMRGNVVDMAVGVMVGGAFSKIVTSLVNDILTPLLSIFMSKESFTELVWNVNGTIIPYGNFIQNIFDFLIISLCIFMMVKLIERFKKPKAVVKEAKVSSTDALLMEILEELKKNK